ncbi:hypothetical protein, partial [Stenotrophomonas sp. HMWF003]|uniref:hypothetical protein n=1 Tax=Stenotrophomonas sp. HMWF003 TaxID=2056840 RepID=UPI001C63224B
MKTGSLRIGQPQAHRNAPKEKAAGEPAASSDLREERSYYFLASSAASLACSAVASPALAA